MKKLAVERERSTAGRVAGEGAEEECERRERETQFGAISFLFLQYQYSCADNI